MFDVCTMTNKIMCADRLSNKQDRSFFYAIGDGWRLVRRMIDPPQSQSLQIKISLFVCHSHTFFYRTYTFFVAVTLPSALASTHIAIMATSATDTSLSQVNIPGYGILQGTIDQQRNIAIFRNVPYAKVPERWRPAVKPDPWAGVRDATKQGYSSHIYDIYSAKFKFGEEKSVMRHSLTSNAETRTAKLMRFSKPVSHL